MRTYIVTLGHMDDPLVEIQAIGVDITEGILRFYGRDSALIAAFAQWDSFQIKD